MSELESHQLEIQKLREALAKKTNELADEKARIKMMPSVSGVADPVRLDRSR